MEWRYAKRNSLEFTNTIIIKCIKLHTQISPKCHNCVFELQREFGCGRRYLGSLRKAKHFCQMICNFINRFRILYYFNTDKNVLSTANIFWWVICYSFNQPENVGPFRTVRMLWRLHAMAYSVFAAVLFLFTAIALYLSYYFGQWKNQPVVCTVSYTIGWLTSLLFVGVLPIDISSVRFLP